MTSSERSAIDSCISISDFALESIWILCSSRRNTVWNCASESQERPLVHLRLLHLLACAGHLLLVVVQIEFFHLWDVSPVRFLCLCSTSACGWAWHRSLSCRVISSRRDCTCFFFLHEQRWSLPSDAWSLIHFRRLGRRCDVLTVNVFWAKTCPPRWSVNRSNLCTADLNDGVGLKTCERTLCAKRPNSPAVMVTAIW